MSVNDQKADRGELLTVTISDEDSSTPSYALYVADEQPVTKAAQAAVISFFAALGGYARLKKRSGIVIAPLTLWLTGARKEAKPTEARPVEPRVRPDRVRCRA